MSASLRETIRRPARTAASHPHASNTYPGEHLVNADNVLYKGKLAMLYKGYTPQHAQDISFFYRGEEVKGTCLFLEQTTHPSAIHNAMVITSPKAVAPFKLELDQVPPAYKTSIAMAALEYLNAADAYARALQKRTATQESRATITEKVTAANATLSFVDAVQKLQLATANLKQQTKVLQQGEPSATEQLPMHAVNAEEKGKAVSLRPVVWERTERGLLVFAPKADGSSELTIASLVGPNPKHVTIPLILSLRPPVKGATGKSEAKQLARDVMEAINRGLLPEDLQRTDRPAPTATEVGNRLEELLRPKPGMAKAQRESEAVTNHRFAVADVSAHGIAAVSRDSSSRALG